MAPRTRRLLLPLSAFIFAILALVFSLLAITSKKWAVRDNYDPNFAPVDWTKPIYTLYRSPFIICAAHPVNNTVPTSSSAAATTAAASSTSSPSPIYKVDCTHYRPFGLNRTSCELEVATQTDTASTIGDARLCQQIHYAGNFGIASTLFIGLGFLMTGTMVAMTFLRARKGFPATTEHGSQSHHGKVSAQDEIIGNEPGASSDAVGSHGHDRGARPSLVASHINLMLVLFFFIGFTTGLLSQYYAILGFMQSLPNQSDFASSTGSGASTETNVHGNHGPWYQGVGLSVYATCAWAFTAAAGTTASRTWRLPRWNMVL